MTWSSSDDSIATVNEEGKVTAVHEGEATITSALKSDTSIQSGCTVTVTPLTCGIKLEEQSGSCKVGESKIISATCVLEDETIKPTLKWSSADKNIATVDEKGTVTGAAPGTVDITVSYEDYKAVYTLTVKAPLQSISMKDAELTLEKGETAQENIAYEPADTTDDKTGIMVTNSDDSAMADNVSLAVEGKTEASLPKQAAATAVWLKHRQMEQSQQLAQEKQRLQQQLPKVLRQRVQS